jgi:hypothetical protein
MNAEQVIELIQTLEPTEIERFLVLIKEYEAEVRRRQGSTRYIPDEGFEKIVDEIFTTNSELFQKLADFEAKERAQE